MGINYKDKAYIPDDSSASNFNPFIHGRENFNPTYKSLVWRILLTSLNAVDKKEINGQKSTGLTPNVALSTSVFKFVLDNADFPRNSFGDMKFSTLVQALAIEKAAAALDIEHEPQAYWNPSMEAIFDRLFSITNPDYYGNEDIKNNKNAAFRLMDILSANAGYSFSGEPWVIPWKNRKGISYSSARSDDKIEEVLNDDSNLQYTNGNPYEHTKTVGELKRSSLDFEEGQVIFTDDDEHEKFNVVLFDPETNAIIYDYDEEIGDDEIVGVQLMDGLVNFLNQIQIQTITTERDQWIRLLMPKYLRNVEVEDLNRNFWVIGQVLDLILYYLYDPNGILGQTFKDMTKELEEMWNNIEYLWGAVIANGKDNTPEQVTWHVETININPFDMRFAKLYDRNSLSTPELIRDTVLRPLSYFKHQYINQNIALIPCIEDEFYEQNYHSKICIPGLLIFQRFKEENGETKNVKNPDFEWYNNIDEINLTFDEISGGNFGSGFYDDGENFHYCSINAAKGDDCYYGAFRPQIRIQNSSNITYNFSDVNLPDDLAIKIKWIDAGIKAMKGTASWKENPAPDDSTPNIANISDTPKEINVPAGGLYMGELVSKKITPNIFILPREFRVPLSTGNDANFTINGSAATVSTEISNMNSKYLTMAEKFSENVYGYVSDVDSAFDRSVGVSGLSSDNSNSSVWIFRMASVEIYDNLKNVSSISNAIETSLDTAKAQKDVKYVEPRNLSRYLFILANNNKMYCTNEDFGVPALKYRSHASLYNPLNGSLSYKCHIVSLDTSAGINNGEHKNFYVICKGNKLTKNNWAVLFIYGRSDANNTPKENVISIFYPEADKCETIRLRYDDVWSLQDYWKGDELSSISFSNSSGNRLSDKSGTYWNEFFSNTSAATLYHSKKINPDSSRADIFTDSFDFILSGLGSRLENNNYLIGEVN